MKGPRQRGLSGQATAGQATTEMILMMLVFLGATYFVSSAFRGQNFIAQLVSGPWLHLSGMIQNGVWGPPTQTMSQHPNQLSRFSTPLGEAPK
jgi:hypothetical protein